MGTDPEYTERELEDRADRADALRESRIDAEDQARSEEADYDRTLNIALDLVSDDIKDLAREAMVEWGWATDEGTHYKLTDLGRKQLEQFEEDDGADA